MSRKMLRRATKDSLITLILTHLIKFYGVSWGCIFNLSLSLFFQPIKSHYMTPLQAIAKEPKPYISPSVVKSAESPFYMENENDMKRFMSGEKISLKSLVFKAKPGFEFTSHS